MIAACTDRTATDDTSSTGSETSTGEAPTTTIPTGGAPTTTADATTGTTATTGPDATTGSTGDPLQTTGTTTGEPDETTGTSTGTTVADSEADTDALQPACPSPCERTVVHDGDLTIGPGVSTADLVCVTRVTGDVSIHGDHDEASLAGLSGLEQVDGLLRVEGSSSLQSAAPFGCLREAGELQLLDLPQLADISALAGLTRLGRFGLSDTAVTALPELAAPELGLHTLELLGNPGIVDLDALTTWTAGASLDIWLQDMDGLTSVAGLAPLLTGVTGDAVSVLIQDAPKLASITGLEPLVAPQKWINLLDLPKVPDLKPLAKLESVGGLHISGMPLVKSLAGLEKVKSVDLLVLGGCINGGPDAGGMDGLTSLAGLDSLTTTDMFAIANSDKLSALTGAPLLKGKLSVLDMVNNPLIDQGDVDALVSQLGQPPESSCVGDWNECGCIFFMPP